MIQDVDITRIVPRFILRDRNGWAMAKAIEAGMKRFLAIANEAVGVMLDPDVMPEWRLDEIAWEYNLLYDYEADVEVKRGWIRSARQFTRKLGTKDGIVEYLKAAFDEVILEEWPEYGGDPYHFRVTLTGNATEHGNAWANKTVNTVKNLRSALDSITIHGGESEMGLAVGTAAVGTEIRIMSISEA